MVRVLLLLWHSFDTAQNVRAKSIGYRNACYDTHFRNPLILLNSIDLVPQQDYGGMQWRTIGLLTGIPFTTMYSCFARWNRLGLWKGLVVDLLRRWRVACGDKSNPSVLVADSRSCRSS